MFIFSQNAATFSLQSGPNGIMLHCSNPRIQETPMEVKTGTGASAPRSTPTRAGRRPRRRAVRRPGQAETGCAPLEPATATMAIISRCASYTLNQQVENAYRAATQARDCARAAAATAERDLPPGPARDVLVTTWARQEADAERLMRAVLRFGREHGHLAFAFSVYS
jgi:hypothetical protein